MTYLAVDAAAAKQPGWSWVPLRRVARIRRETNSDSSARLLSLSAARGVEPRPDDGGRQLPSDATVTGYWLVHADDLVFNPMWAIEGGVAVSEYVGAVSTAYRVYDLAPSIYPKFIHHWFRSSVALDQYRLLVRGITTFDRSVTREDFESMPVPVPPIATQRAIAKLLDRETARIDALTSAQRRMIELLNERDLALVSNILLPDDVGMGRLGYVATLQTGLTVDAARESGPTAVTRPYLRVANVQDGWLDLNEVSYVSISSVLAARSTLRPGDVLMTEGGDLDKLGRGTVWQGQLDGCLHQNHIFAVRPEAKRLDPTYLALLTRTSHARQYFESTGARTTNLASTNSEKILGMPVPRLELAEQSKLVSLYEASSRPLQKLRSDIEKQGRLLIERRQALITAGVTGQIQIPLVVA